MVNSGKIYLIGLGNVGEKYEGTRHNAGFLFLDSITNNFNQDKLAKAFVGSVRLADRDTVCIKPSTYMNNSGEAVSYIIKNDAQALERMIVLYDDIDLPLGKIRIARGGGSGGHNGVKSIEDHTKSRDFIRIKIGISRVGADGTAEKPKGGIFTSKASAVSSFVLKPFTKDEREALDGAFTKVKAALESIIKDGEQSAMNKFN